MTKTQSMRVPADVLAEMAKIAKVERRSLSNLVRVVLEDWVAEWKVEHDVRSEGETHGGT